MISSVPFHPSGSPVLDSGPFLPRQLCPRVSYTQSLHAPWGVPGPGADGFVGSWAGVLGCPFSFGTCYSSPRLFPGSSIQGGPMQLLTLYNLVGGVLASEFCALHLPYTRIRYSLPKDM